MTSHVDFSVLAYKSMTTRNGIKMIELGNQIREENITSFKVYMMVCGAIIIAMTVTVFVVTYLSADHERKVSFIW